MKVESTITHGDILVALSFIGSVLSGLLLGGRRILQVVRRIELSMSQLATEHELLVMDYCERHDIKPHELTTRLQTILSWRQPIE